MGLRPGWRFLAILNPMDQGGLVAPLGEPRHNPAVHARLHKGAHRRFVTPDGAGPESAIGIAEFSSCSERDGAPGIRVGSRKFALDSALEESGFELAVPSDGAVPKQE